jgi:hypothetical protein
MVEHIAHLNDVTNAPPLHFEQGDIRRYTIPLVFEWRFFLVERPADIDLWTVFRFQGEDLVIDFFRNEPSNHAVGQAEAVDAHTLAFTEMESASRVYAIEIEPEQSTLAVTYDSSVLRHPVIDGCLILGGPLCVVNRAEEGTGIPIGAYTWRNYEINFGLDLPDVFRKRFRL